MYVEGSIDNTTQWRLENTGNVYINTSRTSLQAYNNSVGMNNHDSKLKVKYGKKEQRIQRRNQLCVEFISYAFHQSVIHDSHFCCISLSYFIRPRHQRHTQIAGSESFLKNIEVQWCRFDRPLKIGYLDLVGSIRHRKSLSWLLGIFQLHQMC